MHVHMISVLHLDSNSLHAQHLLHGPIESHTASCTHEDCVWTTAATGHGSKCIHLPQGHLPQAHVCSYSCVLSINSHNMRREQDYAKAWTVKLCRSALQSCHQDCKMKLLSCMLCAGRCACGSSAMCHSTCDMQNCLTSVC